MRRVASRNFAFKNVRLRGASWRSDPTAMFSRPEKRHSVCLRATSCERQAMHSLGVIPGVQARFRSTVTAGYGGASERACVDCNDFPRATKYQWLILPFTWLSNSISTTPRGELSLVLMRAAAISKSHFINPTACYAIRHAQSLQNLALDLPSESTHRYVPMP